MLKEKNESAFTEEELEYMECLYTPRCLIESYFHNFDSLGDFDDDLFGHIRLFQLNMLSYEPFVDTNVPGLTSKQRFELRKNVGDCINLGARKYGKTLITLKLDLMVSAIHCAGEQCGFTSISNEKINTVLDDVRQGLEDHPFYKMYRPQVSASGGYKIRLNNGFRCLGINMDVTSKKAGKQFYGKHYRRLYIEERSLETDRVFNLRKDSVSEEGCVFREAGMTNFTEHSPAGKEYYDPKNIRKVVSYPQYINSSSWDENEKQDKIRDFNGIDSFDYRVFVAAEILRDGISEIDMDRVRTHYKDRMLHKTFTLKKENYSNYQSRIVVERPKGAEAIYINADIGDGRGGTEIIIHSRVGKKFVWLYRIVLYSWTEEEQEDLFTWLGHKLSVDVMGLDCGEGVGRGLFRSLEKVFGKDVMVWYAGNDKVVVDYEKNDKGELVYSGGKPVAVEEVMASWSFKTLRELLYSGNIQMGCDYFLHHQLEMVVSIQSQDGSRRRYFCSLEDDHLFDAHRVFANSYFQKEGVELNKNECSDWGIGSMGGNGSATVDKSDGSWGIGSSGRVRNPE